MVLRVLAGNWVQVGEYKMNLISETTLVRTKHDGIGGVWGDMGVNIFTKQFNVSTAAIKAILQFDLVLEEEGGVLVGWVDGGAEWGVDGIVSSFVCGN